MIKNINNAELVVLGAGPAGLCAAISAARKLQGKPAQVLLLDANPQPGVKLLISGSGQCNFSNALEPELFIKKLGKYGNYLKSAYLNFDSKHFCALLETGGCRSVIREDLKVFPENFKATSVLHALLNLAKTAGVNISCASRLIAVTKTPEGGYQLSLESGEELACRKLIFATGGASYPATGSDGKALKFAKALGHQVIPFRPHLSSVTIKNFENYTPCAGNTVSGAQARFITDAGGFDAVGDLLIMHGGFSGPLILDNSYLLKKGDIIEMNWVPHADELLLNLKKQLRNTFLINALASANLPHGLLSAILSDKAGTSTLSIAALSKKELQRYGNYLMHSQYEVSQVAGFARAMASAGGIPLAEINAKTMQSRVCPGLYFAGEILDYALPSGGFNIQMAASTGWMAGENAAMDLGFRQ